LADSYPDSFSCSKIYKEQEQEKEPKQQQDDNNLRKSASPFNPVKVTSSRLSRED